MTIFKKIITTYNNEGLKKLLLKSKNYINRKYFKKDKNIFQNIITLIKIKRFIKNNKNPNIKKIINFLFNNNLTIRPAQIKYELKELLELLILNNPKYVLEIGTYNGGTLFTFSQISNKKSTIISLDLPNGKYGGGYPNWKKKIYKAFILKTQKIHLIRKNSHLKESYLEVKSILKNKKLDFLFIDGDHTYDGVKKDFKLYSTFVKKGGIIALHDIVVHPPKLNCHVNEFWKELKNKYKYKEIIKNKNQGWGGIGIIYK